jgi:hypothetical protein
MIKHSSKPPTVVGCVDIPVEVFEKTKGSSWFNLNKDLNVNYKSPSIHVEFEKTIAGLQERKARLFRRSNSLDLETKLTAARKNTQTLIKELSSVRHSRE